MSDYQLDKDKHLQENYLALFLAIIWYRELSPTVAVKAVKGIVHLKPERTTKLTEQELIEIDKIINNHKPFNYHRLERKYKKSIYTIDKEFRHYGNINTNICKNEYQK